MTTETVGMRWQAPHLRGISNLLSDPEFPAQAGFRTDTSYIVKFELQVSMHHALDADTKTVIDGRLFSIESLPPETLMYAPISAMESKSGKSAIEVMKYVRDAVEKQKNIIQIGAGASTSQGTCYLQWKGDDNDGIS